VKQSVNNDLLTIKNYTKHICLWHMPMLSESTTASKNHGKSARILQTTTRRRLVRICIDERWVEHGKGQKSS